MKHHLKLLSVIITAVFSLVFGFSFQQVSASEDTDLIPETTIDDEATTTETTNQSELGEKINNEDETTLDDVVDPVDGEEEEELVEEQSDEEQPIENNQNVSEESPEPSNAKSTNLEVETESKDNSSVDDASEKEEQGSPQESEMSILSVSTELPYKKGDNHEKIIPVKVKLNALGFDGIAETGNFGSHTEKRVKEFQAYYGLKVTGQVDQLTLDKLNEVYNSTYQNGNSHSYITEIKKMLNALGYGGLAEGPVFGNLTEKRVKEFQQDNGLKAHGIADDPTIAALENAYNKSVYKKGDHHPAVTEIKRKLNALGFSGLALSGNFGSLTEKRIKEFQSYYGLSVTGVADQQTQDKLSVVYNSPYQNGKSDSYTTEIKKMLNAIGYDGLAEGPVFGNLTEKRVKEFQQDNGLKAHGIADEPTIAALKNAYSKTEFKKGDNHPTVIEIKRNLNRLGFSGLALSGNYGSLTEKRVKQFQEYYGLKATGVADRATQEKLNEVVNSPYQKGKKNTFTAEIKKMLNILGYNGLADGSSFGSLTEKRVKQFQRDHGLKSHGIADEVTIKRLESEYQNSDDFLKKGDRKPAVIDLKKKLNSLGYDGLALTNNFGSLTEKRVKQFQRDYGLKDYGVVDERTSNKINSVLATSLKKGDRKAAVIQLKRDLNSLGYDGLALTNNFGSLTEKRVKQFQRDHNLPANGIADERTLQKIENSFLKIFIDPGHGGSDPGALGYNLREKDVVLDIGLKIKQELEKYAGVKVMLSRASDKTVSLDARTRAANNWNADYFVSLHNNAAGGAGFETFIYNGSVSQETKNRQRDIHKHLANWLSSKNNIRDRGMKRANYHVVRETKMPSLLIEYMFIDNYRENQLLKSKSYRNSLGKVTADAIAKSFNLKKR
ncbi:peptidoglycan-binding protein [Oceanobacillus luteolus]|uniref:Peptidoglycan-binding protein n=1 Tax=Oceanobacillus luteolus TaxID=1274358 RepID=A0ABW4HPA7_9BACI